MPIGQKSRKQVKTVRVMHDADPRRVSLVDHGANQTPFREVKAVSKQLGDIAETEKETTMPNETVTKSGAELVKVSFSKSKFASEGDVKKWMTEKGYTEPTSIDSSEDKFTVTAPEFSATKSEDMRVVEAEDGVEYTLSKAADAVDGSSDDSTDTATGDTTTKSTGGNAEDVDDEPEDDDDTEGDDIDEVLKAENAEVVKELTAKVNQMRVYYSDKTGMKDVLKEADDGMPIGVGDLFGLFSKALENAAKSGDSSTVKSVSAEFGTMFTEMMDITNKFIAGSKAAGNADTTAKSAAPDTKVSDDAGTAAADATVAPTEEEKTANLLKGVQSTLEEQVAKAATQAQDSLNTAMKEVTELVTTLTNEVKSLTARISDLESTEQTRKGADEEAGKAPSTTKKSEMSALEKNIWGFR